MEFCVDDDILSKLKLGLRVPLVSFVCESFFPGQRVGLAFRIAARIIKSIHFLCVFCGLDS